MEVVQRDQFESSQEIIGGQGETRGFAVSNDAGIMNLLSTALYSNPLRAMLQEVIMNAWDAHKAAGITDTPIEVSITKELGLTVLDKGHGIAEADMQDIYCTYGNSTKVNDSNQTGGFGLGAKSPFAYTEAFQVSSCDSSGMRTLFTISRAMDEVEGKPGMRKLAGFPCSETGLIVTVPLKKENTLGEVRNLIFDIFKWSGVLMNFTFDKEEPKKIRFPESRVVEIGNKQRNHAYYDNEKVEVYAVYGGICYPIPDMPLYSSLLREIKASLIGSTIYVTFPPNSLTPLPSREGLNVSPKTEKTIYEQLGHVEDFVLKELTILMRKTSDIILKFTEGDAEKELLLVNWLIRFRQRDVTGGLKTLLSTLGNEEFADEIGNSPVNLVYTYGLTPRRRMSNKQVSKRFNLLLKLLYRGFKTKKLKSILLKWALGSIDSRDVQVFANDIGASKQHKFCTKIKDVFNLLNNPTTKTGPYLVAYNANPEAKIKVNLKGTSTNILRPINKNQYMRGVSLNTNHVVISETLVGLNDLFTQVDYKNMFNPVEWGYWFNTSLLCIVVPRNKELIKQFKESLEKRGILVTVLERKVLPAKDSAAKTKPRAKKRSRVLPINHLLEENWKDIDYSLKGDEEYYVYMTLNEWRNHSPGFRFKMKYLSELYPNKIVFSSTAVGVKECEKAGLKPIVDLEVEYIKKAFKDKKLLRNKLMYAQRGHSYTGPRAILINSPILARAAGLPERAETTPLYNYYFKRVCEGNFSWESDKKLKEVYEWGKEQIKACVNPKTITRIGIFYSLVTETFSYSTATLMINDPVAIKQLGTLTKTLTKLEVKKREKFSVLAMLVASDTVTLISEKGEQTVLDYNNSMFDLERLVNDLTPLITGTTPVDVDLNEYTITPAVTPQENKGIQITVLIDGQQVQGTFIPNNTSIDVKDEEGEVTRIDNINKSLHKQIKRAYDEKSPAVLAFIKRLVNVIKERKHSADDLLSFMARSELPLTNDGRILAYKRVNRHVKGYKDVHTGNIKQDIGDRVCMNISDVDPDRATHCSYGLHVANLSYMSRFHGSTIIMVLVEPENFIAVPNDGSNKARVCQYDIIGEVPSAAINEIKGSKTTVDVEFAKLIKDALEGNHVKPSRRLLVKNDKVVETTPIEQEDVKPTKQTERSPESLQSTQGGEPDLKKSVKRVPLSTQARNMYELWVNGGNKQSAKDLLIFLNVKKVSPAKMGFTPEEQSKITSFRKAQK